MPATETRYVYRLTFVYVLGTRGMQTRVKQILAADEAEARKYAPMFKRTYEELSDVENTDETEAAFLKRGGRVEM